MNFVNSIFHGFTMEHPNKRTIRKLRCYESIHENTLFFFVHVMAHFIHVKIKIKSCLIQDPHSRFPHSVLEVCISTGILKLAKRCHFPALATNLFVESQ